MRCRIGITLSGRDDRLGSGFWCWWDSVKLRRAGIVDSDWDEEDEGGVIAPQRKRPADDYPVAGWLVQPTCFSHQHEDDSSITHVQLSRRTFEK
jgi:hypothetical protein